MIEAMTVVIILKIGLCGSSFCYYLSKHFNVQSDSIVMFSLFYSLSGFMAAYNWNIMWLDSIALAPLIILGLEKLVSEGKWKFYCITLALCVLTNYYISIMICIFLILYFIILILFIPWKQKGTALIRFALSSSILAACMAALSFLCPESWLLPEPNSPGRLSLRHLSTISLQKKYWRVNA
jgi:uncharacterized membrane protein YfhO